jgi:uncharacterized protein YxjI
MPLPPPPVGWSRFLVKSKFGAGRDFIVSDPETEVQHYFVDGKLSLRPSAEITTGGDPMYRVRGTLLGIPPIKSQMTVDLASGEAWTLEGSLMEKNYTASIAGRPIVQISQKWMTIKDTYTLDVAGGIDPGLALAVLWSVDRWVERD